MERAPRSPWGMGAATASWRLTVSSPRSSLPIGSSRLTGATTGARGGARWPSCFGGESGLSEDKELTMDFSETPKVRTVRAVVREFVEQELLPIEATIRHDGFEAHLPLLREKREKARQTGLFAAHLPEAVGGAGL